MNIWLDYTANAVYFDNVRNNPAAIIQTRLRSTIGTPVVAITTGVDGSVHTVLQTLARMQFLIILSQSVQLANSKLT